MSKWPGDKSYEAFSRYDTGDILVTILLSLYIQIWWKIHIAVIHLRVIRLPQFFTHTTTVVLSCYMQTFVVITSVEFG